MSKYTPPQDYSLVREENDSYEQEPNGIMLRPVLQNPLLSNGRLPMTVNSAPQSAPQMNNEVSHVVQPGPPAGVTSPYMTSNLARNASRRPPPIGTGKWADDICDWPANLYPSCYCACFVCNGIYILGQMAEKTGFATFSNTLLYYFMAWMVGIVLSLATGLSPFLFPFIFALGFSILLRLHIVRKFAITEPPACGECCCGFCCFSCSVAQMARHVYGYNKMIDGDGDWERPDSYGGPVTHV